MPCSVLTRKKLVVGAVASGPRDLLAAAIKDGMTISYLFNESSGNLLDQSAAHWDLASHAQVTRSAAAVAGPDKLGYTYVVTSQAAPTFGHTQGQRPLISTYNKIAFECVCKITTGTAQAVMQGAAVGLANLFGLGSDANGDVTGFILLTGGNTQGYGTNTRNTKVAYQHYIWQYTGTNFQGYVQGVNAWDIVTTIGSATFFDDTLANARLAFGGNCDTGANNVSATIDFFAMYGGLSLTPGQIASHFRLSGC